MRVPDMLQHGVKMGAIGMFVFRTKLTGGFIGKTPVVSEAAAQSAQTATYHVAFRASAHVPCLKSPHDSLS